MGRLKTALQVLLDESQPIQVRLDKITDTSGPLYIKGLGRAVLTPILMCVYPDKYAVYNRISEEGLTQLGRNRAKANDSFGKRYVTINEACHEIANEINQPLSLIDSMFSLMVHGPDSPLEGQAAHGGGAEVTAAKERESGRGAVIADAFVFPFGEVPGRFSRFKLGQDCSWQSACASHIGNEESATQYPTGLGPIDILARDKADHNWVVIELKKGKSSDTVVGQLLRYMGWVKKHKASGNEKVRGIIITSAPDDRIKYAMLASQGVVLHV